MISKSHPLANFLKVLHPSQLLYADTDSCYFAYNPKNKNHINPETTDFSLIEPCIGLYSPSKSPT